MPADTANGLLAHLSLLLVAAGVGVMNHLLKLLGDQWLPLTTSLLVSTLLTVAVTGWIMQRLTRGPQTDDRGGRRPVGLSQRQSAAAPDVDGVPVRAGT